MSERNGGAATAAPTRWENKVMHPEFVSQIIRERERQLTASADQWSHYQRRSGQRTAVRNIPGFLFNRRLAIAVFRAMARAGARCRPEPSGHRSVQWRSRPL